MSGRDHSETRLTDEQLTGPAMNGATRMTATNDNEPAVFTVTELAKRWRTSRLNIYALIRAGKIGTFKIGKRGLRVTLAEVRRYETEKAA